MQEPMNGVPYALDQISTEQFRYLGTRQMVYLKVGAPGDEQTCVIYGADGTLLEVVDGLETAVERVAQSGLRLVAVH